MIKKEDFSRQFIHIPWRILGGLFLTLASMYVISKLLITSIQSLSICNLRELSPLCNEIEGLINFIFQENIESFAILFGAILYIIDSRERIQKDKYEAWQVIDRARGIRTSYARVKAIEFLAEYNEALRGLDLPGADLTGIALNNTDISNSNFHFAILSRANLKETDLSKSILREAVFSDFSGKAGLSTDVFTNLENANLENCDLRLADLRNVHLEGANLSGADLRGANLLHANLNFVRLNGVKIDQNTRLNRKSAIAIYVSAFFSNRTKPVSLDKRDLRKSDLSRLNLEGLDLSNLLLDRSLFVHSLLANSNMFKVSARFANFTKADLSMVNFQRANLRNALLTGANLTNADLTGANLTNADLTGANLTNANLTGANLTGANLERTIYGRKLLGIR
jgi:uncharacterized protein YjbI with pentapeptide repeats